MTRHKRISIVITTVFGFIYIMANAQLSSPARPRRSGRSASWRQPPC